MFKINDLFYVVSGVAICDTNKHPIAFCENGEKVMVPPSGVVINADTEDRPSTLGEMYVNTVFIPNEEGLKDVERIKQEWAALNRDEPMVIVGSLAAAQAYPEVMAMTPHPGFERELPQNKLMNPRKFNTCGW